MWKFFYVALATLLFSAVTGVQSNSVLLDRNAPEMSLVGGGTTLSARCDLRPTTPLPCPATTPPIFCVSGGCGGLTCDAGFYEVGQWFCVAAWFSSCTRGSTPACHGSTWSCNQFGICVKNGGGISVACNGLGDICF